MANEPNEQTISILRSFLSQAIGSAYQHYRSKEEVPDYLRVEINQNGVTTQVGLRKKYIFKILRLWAEDYIPSGQQEAAENDHELLLLLGRNQKLRDTIISKIEPKWLNPIFEHYVDLHPTGDEPVTPETPEHQEVVEKMEKEVKEEKQHQKEAGMFHPKPIATPPHIDTVKAPPPAQKSEAAIQEQAKVEQELKTQIDHALAEIQATQAQPEALSTTVPSSPAGGSPEIKEVAAPSPTIISEQPGEISSVTFPEPSAPPLELPSSPVPPVFIPPSSSAEPTDESPRSSSQMTPPNLPHSNFGVGNGFGSSLNRLGGKAFNSALGTLDRFGIGGSGNPLKNAAKKQAEQQALKLAMRLAANTPVGRGIMAGAALIILLVILIFVGLPMLMDLMKSNALLGPPVNGFTYPTPTGPTSGGSGGLPTPGNGPDVSMCRFTRSGASTPFKSTILSSWVSDAATANGIPPAILASVARHESPEFTTNADDNHDAIKSGEYCNPGPTLCVSGGIKEHDGPCSEGETQDGWRSVHAEGLMQILDLDGTKGDLCNISNNLKWAAADLKQKIGSGSFTDEESVKKAICRYFGIDSDSCNYGGGDYAAEVWNDYLTCQPVARNPVPTMPGHPIGPGRVAVPFLCQVLPNYGDGAGTCWLASDGCGPTSFTMAANALGYNFSPVDVAQALNGHGFGCYDGADSSVPDELSSPWFTSKFTYKTIPINKDAVNQALDDGYVLIGSSTAFPCPKIGWCAGGAGATVSHIFVIDDAVDDNTITVKDPIDCRPDNVGGAIPEQEIQGENQNIKHGWENWPSMRIWGIKAK